MSQVQRGPKEIPIIGSDGKAKALLEGKIEELKRILPSTLTPDRLIKTVGLAIAGSKAHDLLLQSTPESFLFSIYSVAELGLDFSPSLGQAYLVPFKNGELTKASGRPIYEIKPILGYRGLIQLMTRHPEVIHVRSDLVYEKEIELDLFQFTPSDIHNPIRHQRYLGVDIGNVVGAYMLTVLEHGIVRAEWMNIRELQSVKARSRAKDNGPWITDESEMFRKCPIKRGWKQLPAAIEMAKALEIDADTIELGDGEYRVDDGDDANGEKSRAAAIADKLRQRKAKRELKERPGGEGNNDPCVSEPPSVQADPSPPVEESDPGESEPVIAPSSSSHVSSPTRSDPSGGDSFPSDAGSLPDDDSLFGPGDEQLATVPSDFGGVFSMLEQAWLAESGEKVDPLELRTLLAEYLFANYSIQFPATGRVDKSLKEKAYTALVTDFDLEALVQDLMISKGAKP